MFYRGVVTIEAQMSVDLQLIRKVFCEKIHIV